MVEVLPLWVIPTWSAEVDRGLFNRILPPARTVGAAPVPPRAEFPEAFSALPVWLPCRIECNRLTNSLSSTL